MHPYTRPFELKGSLHKKKVTLPFNSFSKLETDLEKAKSQPESTEGIDPGMDPIGWLKEQWHKEPIKKKGLERLKKRAGGR